MTEVRSMYKNLTLFFLSFLPSSIAFCEDKPLQLEKPARILRVDGSIEQPKISPDSHAIVYTSSSGQGLWVLRLIDGVVNKITNQQTKAAYLWAPDSSRIFYRELTKTKNGDSLSTLKAYDTAQNKSHEIATIEGSTSAPVFDPRDNRLRLMSRTGVKSFKLNYPMQRLARWQAATKGRFGYWLVGPDQIYWLSNKGVSLDEVANREGKILDFAVSPFGDYMAWSQSNGMVYMSKLGANPMAVAAGRDVSWHPDGKHLLFAMARKVGRKVVDHDIAIADTKGRTRTLLVKPESDERSPLWLKKSASIIYTHKGSTDLFELKVKM